jgi:hypothetical protein
LSHHETRCCGNCEFFGKLVVSRLRRAPQLTKLERYDTAATWDIIRNYASLPDDVMENISSLIDAPENGMTLNIAAHQSFWFGPRSPISSEESHSG